MAAQKSIFRNSFDGEGYRLNASKFFFVRFFRWNLYFLIEGWPFQAWDSDHLIHKGSNIVLGFLRKLSRLSP